MSHLASVLATLIEHSFPGSSNEPHYMPIAIDRNKRFVATGASQKNGLVFHRWNFFYPCNCSATVAMQLFDCYPLTFVLYSYIADR